VELVKANVDALIERDAVALLPLDEEFATVSHVKTASASTKDFPRRAPTSTTVRKRPSTITHPAPRTHWSWRRAPPSSLSSHRPPPPLPPGKEKSSTFRMKSSTVVMMAPPPILSKTTTSSQGKSRIKTTVSKKVTFKP